MIAWLAPIVVFGLVIFVHELGHFLAAKAVGVYAPRFSIGFGPALFRRRVGETEYILAALPLGGYVRMASREDEAIAFLEGGSEEKGVGEVGANGVPVGQESTRPAGKDWDPEAMRPYGPKPVPEHRWFESKPLWARLMILIAGVTMNVLLTLVVSTAVFAGYGRATVQPVIDSVIAGRPAAAAGLRVGDSIVAIGGTPVSAWPEIVERVGQSPGTPIDIDVVRQGQRHTVRVTPQLTEVFDSATGRGERAGRIGAAPRIGREPVTFPQAVAGGWRATWGMAGAVVGFVGQLFTGNISASQVGGPIAIARTSVEAARSGLETFLSLLAFLSVNIAILNLLPIPVLDGGQIAMQLLEAAKGSPFSARTRDYILRFGLVTILAIFVLVMFNDLTR